MRVTYEPDMPGEDNLKKVVHEKVFEFAIVGTNMVNEVVPTPISHSHGKEISRMIGQLEQLKVELMFVLLGIPKPIVDENNGDGS